jgi:sulfatase modifying factor 1
MNRFLGLGIIAAIVALITLFGGRSKHTESPPAPLKVESHVHKSPMAPLKEESHAPRTEPPKNFTSNTGMRFVWVSPGSFMMGSSREEKQRSDYECQHPVPLTKGFYMGVYTVTQEQWQAVMGNNPSLFKCATLPVEQVSWEDCQTFCAKMQAMEHKAFRLPFESEWEYCCRAGTTTRFYFGDMIATDQANFNGQLDAHGRQGVYREKTTPAGNFPANAWGLADMHGNVWQWCQDWYGDYPQFAVVDPQGPSTGDFRVLRGGSWSATPDLCRAASRTGSTPDHRSVIVGFRVCFGLDE